MLGVLCLKGFRTFANWGDKFTFSLFFPKILIWRVTSSCGVLCDFQLPCAWRFSWYTDCSRDALWLMQCCCGWIIQPLYESTVVYNTPAVYKLYSARFSSLVWRPSPLYSPRLWSPGAIRLERALCAIYLSNVKFQGTVLWPCAIPNASPRLDSSAQFQGAMKFMPAMRYLLYTTAYCF